MKGDQVAIRLLRGDVGVSVSLCPLSSLASSLSFRRGDSYPLPSLLSWRRLPSPIS